MANLQNVMLSSISRKTKQRRITEISVDLLKVERDIKELDKRIEEYRKYEGEKPKGSLPHICSECWQWKKLRTHLRGARSKLLYEKKILSEKHHRDG